MSRQFMILILATCFIMEGVLSAPAASPLLPDANSLLMLPGNMEKISKATQELEDVFKMLRRRKRSLSSQYLQIIIDQENKRKTTPTYASS